MNPEPISNQISKSNSILVPLAIIIAGGMVAVAIYFSGGGKQAGVIEDQKDIVVEPISARDHILGNPRASVVIVEYSDLECPFCKVFHNTMHQIVEEYGDKVAWVYRHFPIAKLHTKAAKEAEASECAAELGGNTIFWKYIDKVFATTQGNDSLDLTQLPAIAVDLGLDGAKFNECLDGGKYKSFIDESIKKSIDAGGRGTPYSVILKDGKQVDTINGAEPIESVRLKISEALR